MANFNELFMYLLGSTEEIRKKNFSGMKSEARTSRYETEMPKVRSATWKILLPLKNTKFITVLPYRKLVQYNSHP